MTPANDEQQTDPIKTTPWLQRDPGRLHGL